MHKLESFVENEVYKIFKDLETQTDHRIQTGKRTNNREEKTLQACGFCWI